MTVYFIQQGSDGPIKIGYTTQPPEKRLAGLQTANPYPLSLVGVWPDGTMQDERDLHERFAASRLSGEWFIPTDALMSLVAEHPVIDWSAAIESLFPKAGESGLGPAFRLRLILQLLTALEMGMPSAFVVDVDAWVQRFSSVPWSIIGAAFGPVLPRHIAALGDDCGGVALGDPIVSPEALAILARNGIPTTFDVPSVH